MTKVIIAGGREFDDINYMGHALGRVLALKAPYTIISGGARGADQLGEDWAERRMIPVEQFIPNWDTHGKKAGYLRNADMADEGDILVAFWDGESKGTKSMISLALRKGLEVHVFRYGS